MKGDLVWVKQHVVGTQPLQVNPNQIIQNTNPTIPARWNCPLCHTEMVEARNMPQELTCTGCKAQFEKVPNHYIHPCTYGYRVSEDPQLRDRMAVLLDIEPEKDKGKGPTQNDIEAVLASLWNGREDPNDEYLERVALNSEDVQTTPVEQLERERNMNIVRGKVADPTAVQWMRTPKGSSGQWVLVSGVSTEEEREAFLASAPKSTSLRPSLNQPNIHYWFEGYDGLLPLS